MPDPTTVYHGCHINSVQKIYEGLEIDAHLEGDFNRKLNGRAFYTTADQGFAEYWAGTKANADQSGAAVIQFTVDFQGLDVKRFQTDKTDAKYIGEWQTFVFNNWLDKKRTKKEKGEIHDVVSGFMSNDRIWDGKDENNPPKKLDTKPEIVDGRPVTQIAFVATWLLTNPTLNLFRIRLGIQKETGQNMAKRT